jgi:hypothetical protein
MTEVPKIVYDRLHAASERLAAKTVHLDADLLAAFAEQALSVPERENVLAHLSLCGNCREVISLALPAEGVVGTPSTTGSENARRASTVKVEKGWLSSSRYVWPGLRWTAVAAGVAVAASVLLMHPKKLNQATLLSEKQPTPAIAFPASVAQSPSSPTNQTAVLAKPAETATPTDSESSQSPRRRPTRQQFRQAQSPMLLAENKQQSNDSSDAFAGTATGAKTSNSPTVTNETVEVSAASPLVEISEEPSHDLPLTSRDMAPAIEKAKPAPQSVAGAASVQSETAPPAPSAQMQAQVVNRNMMAQRHSLAPNVTWSISVGVLQQSKDNGQSWQTALHADHSLLTFTSHGDDVWVGGEAGTLYHSIDSGATWAQMQPSTSSQRLSSSITHIAISGPTAIVFSTTNNEVWSTMDGGKTWAKK